jgi:benzoyl-CoA 2,3-dioxygenase component B
LRTEYVRDSERALTRWNKFLAEDGVDGRLYLPSTRFHRHVGTYNGFYFDVQGNLITKDEFERRSNAWLPTASDREYVKSLMLPVTQPGKIASWISPPSSGVNGKPFDFEYVRM